MARKKKPASEMTTEELAKRLFPKQMKKKLDEVAEGNDPKTRSNKSSQE